MEMRNINDKTTKQQEKNDVGGYSADNKKIFFRKLLSENEKI